MQNIVSQAEGETIGKHRAVGALRYKYRVLSKTHRIEICVSRKLSTKANMTISESMQFIPKNSM